MNNIETDKMRENLFKELGYMGQKKPEEEKKDALINSDTFMTLFTTQLRCQNPLDETQDPTKFVSQLAQFSQVESSQNMFNELKSITQSLRSNQVLDATSLLGKKIQAEGEQVKLDNIQIDNNTNKASFDLVKGKIKCPDIAGHMQEGIGSLSFDDVLLSLETLDGKVITRKNLGSAESGKVIDFALDELPVVGDDNKELINSLNGVPVKVSASVRLGNEVKKANTLVGVEIKGVEINNNNLIATTAHGEEIPVSELTHVYE